MTKLSDLRRSLRAGTLQAELAERVGAPDVLRQYKINSSGTDALLLFGKHRGDRLSLLVKTDPSYMNFILENDFPGELKDVVRHVLAARDVGDMDSAARDLERAFKGGVVSSKWTASKRKR